MLPDNVLLKIFDFYRANLNHFFLTRAVWEWHVLVHVCQRWRKIVFASPRHLNLQIPCRYGTPVRKDLRIWPALPIVLDLYSSSSSHLTPDDEDMLLLPSSTMIVCVLSDSWELALSWGRWSL